MRLNTSNPTLFSLSCLFALSSSLPLSPRDVFVPALVPRATYSVVPVDGGADATPGSGGDNTPQVVSTIIKTETSSPKTVVETSKVTLPPVTSTEIVQGPDRTQTITGAPSPTTVTATGYSVINVSSPPVTIEVPAPAAPTTTSIESSSASSSPTSTPTETTPAETSSEQSATPTPIPSPTSAETSSLSTSSSATLSTASATGSSESIPTTTATPQATSSSSTYSTYSTTSSDNGQWHTTYPAWSNSTGTAIPEATSSSATKLPTSAEAVSTPVVRSEGGVKLNKRIEYIPKELFAHQAVQKRDRNSKRTPENKAQWSINKFFM